VSRQENGQSGKKEARNTFVLPAISTLFLFNENKRMKKRQTK
jgi:hypothetical protein